MADSKGTSELLKGTSITSTSNGQVPAEEYNRVAPSMTGEYRHTVHGHNDIPYDNDQTGVAIPSPDDLNSQRAFKEPCVVLGYKKYKFNVTPLGSSSTAKTETAIRLTKTISFYTYSGIIGDQEISFEDYLKVMVKIHRKNK